MNIRFITLKFDQEGGGSNQSLELLAERLSDKHNIEIITFREDLDNIIKPPVNVNQFSCSSRLDTFHTCIQTLQEYEEETDIYHIFTPVLIPAGGIYRKTGGTTPVVGRLNTYSLFCTNPAMMDSKCHKDCTLKKKISHHDVSPVEKLKNFDKYVFNTSALSVSSSVDQCFALSPTVKKIYNEAGLRAPVTVIPNFYDPDLPFLDRSAEEIEKDRILYVGRLVKDKGVESLLKAFFQLETEKLELVIVGDGPEKDQLKKVATESLYDEKITFTGWVPYEQLSEFYAQSSLFVHPGLWPEPFGRTILEAMQHHLPLVVSNVGAPPWVAQDAAVTFSSGSVDDLAKTISNTLSEPKRSEMIENSQNRVDRFSPERIIKEYLNQYQKLVN